MCNRNHAHALFAQVIHEPLERLGTLEVLACRGLIENQILGLRNQDGSDCYEFTDGERDVERVHVHVLTNSRELHGLVHPHLRLVLGQAIVIGHVAYLIAHGLVEDLIVRILEHIAHHFRDLGGGMSPSVHAVDQHVALTAVVLPAPFWPTIATRSPSSMCRVRCLFASKPPGYENDTSLRSIAMATPPPSCRAASGRSLRW